MEERRILDYLLKSARENHEYFSKSNKAARERWVVSEFLKVMAIQHQEEELTSLEQGNKADVQFRDAWFQVKELPDPGLLRGKIYKDAYNSIKAAASLEDVATPSVVQNVPPIATLYELAYERAHEWSNSKQYAASKGELDLLIYITRTRASLIQPHEVEVNAFSSLGWRAVSCVNSKQAVVLFSSPSAPEFVRAKSQTIASAGG